MGDKHSVKTTFFGTTSVYVTDGSSSIFIDAFLSRPSLLRVAFGKLGPDITLIKETLRSANITRCDGIFVAHSHYDHALDAPEVAKLLGSRIYGSDSTLNIARGSGYPKSPSSSSVSMMCTIDAPLVLPGKTSDMKDGGRYSFRIAHPEGSMLIHPSANFVPNKFSNLNVDVLYLGIGVLGAQPSEFQESY
ncbi:hypothetical protein CKM354_000639500 [Cercospora kikuchii]|uniref:Metallo-beta-lactamase domain-containing protein n=1 Tax=Cercospora kikuchii TaxID=84275 RepID=A0A9P3FGG6_9PEZI|nr:uncharacterized protein CKM354_000639500 [Cercospora kikuchii]GIZ43157.1 hypothetical protein CKM354_000639500 [Cercospora kikuchii]